MSPTLTAQRTSPNSVPGLLPVLFFFSGASSLIFETIFTRLLTYTFGNTAHAVSTVLAAFLGGLAAGAYWLGVGTCEKLSASTFQSDPGSL